MLEDIKNAEKKDIMDDVSIETRDEDDNENLYEIKNENDYIME
jgi:hypothetical protein